MSNRNFKKIFIGLILISLGFVILFTAFYFLEVKPELAKRKKAQLASETSRSEQTSKKEEKSESNLQPERQSQKQQYAQEMTVQGEDQNTPETPSQPESVSAGISGLEGFLWVDRKAAKYVITLGTINGIKSGTELTIYDGDKEIGTAVVQEPYGTISYVQPEQLFADQIQKDYYRIVIQ